MGATHPTFVSARNKGNLGYNSSSKKNGTQKRQVACFLKQRGYHDQKSHLIIINRFKFSCKIIVNDMWEDFKLYVDHL